MQPRIGRAAPRARALTTSLQPRRASFTLSLWPARTLEPTDNRLTGGSMDLVAAAVVLALAALSFVWLDFVERA